MSSATMLLSGSLVASGLILGAFTLHGAFEPPRTHARATAQGDPKGVNAFQTTTRAAGGEASQTAKAVVRHDAKPAEVPDAQVVAAARAAAAKRRLAEKRRAEKAEKDKAAKAKQEAAQQATLQWPWNWNLFGK
jgi:hypothetical protein